MNARVFYLKSQGELYRKIGPLLRRHIFDDAGIELEPTVIPDNLGRTSAAADRASGAAYLELLKASMIATDDFTTLIEDSEGNWSYLGYGRTHDVALRLLRKSLPAVFPAVAVMDRMVLVPKGMHEAWKGENVAWLLKPLEMGGVLLVDFADQDSVREGATQVGLRLKTEIAKLCRRHMAMHKSPAPNFDALSELLKIDKSYLEKHQDEILASMVNLTPKIVSGPAQLGRWSKVVLDVRNESEKEMARVRVQVRAPKDTLKKPVVRTLDFSTGEKARRFDFEVSPKAAPYCPLEVLFEMSETSPLYAPFSVPLILDVTP